MKSVLEIQQAEEKLLAEMREMTKSSPEAKPDGWDQAKEELRKLGEQKEYAQDSETIEKRAILAQHSQEEQARGAKDKSDSDEKRMSYENVFNRWMARPRNSTMSDQEIRVLETRGTSTLITTTDSLGGYLVPEAFSNELEMAGVWSGGMMEAARIYNDSRGGTLRWPTGDDTANDGEIILPQGTAKTVVDMNFGNVLFNDYTIDSGIVKVSRELVQDESVGLLRSVLAEQLAERISRKVNSVLTNGTGTNEPYGLTVAVTGTGITAANATSLTKTDLTKMVHSVDKYYRNGPKVGWMMNDETLGYLRTLDFSTDTTHIFADLKIAGEPDMLLGHRVYVNNDLPALTNGLPATGVKYIYFGDFSKYVVRKIKGVSIERNDMLYWNSLSVGFMGWTRLDGNLVNQNAIKALVQA